VSHACNVTSDWVDYRCLDAGEKEPEPGWIKGRFTFDADCNDNEWNDETQSWDAGVADVEVKLINENGDVVATSTTDQYGNYMFDVAPGKYKVVFPTIEGYEFSAKDSGVDEHYDSDADSSGATDWIHLSSNQTIHNIDAGIKQCTGAISGTVFCDINCDGINGETKVVPGCDYTIQAEHMNEWGFQTVSGQKASGGKLVKLNCAGDDGALWTDFQGKDGVYDVKIRVQDECDGRSVIKLFVGGQYVEAIRLDNDNNGGGSDNGYFSTFVIRDVAIHSGEQIKLKAWGDAVEFVRIDKIVLKGQDSVEIVEEPVKEGVTVKLVDLDGNVVATTETDADGNYRFDDVPVGDYKIMGVAPDGTEFTIKDVDGNSKDDIDSDVDSNGMSDVVTVTANGEADIDLGLCDKPLGSIAGRYFCDDNRDDTERDGQGGFDPAVAGATVWLIKAGEGVVAQTTTDQNGDYLFEDLEAGRYSVRFEDPEDVAGAQGKTFVAANQGGEDVDSDVESIAGDGDTAFFDLTEGEDKADVDAGIRKIFLVCDDPNSINLDFEGFAAGTVIDDEYAGVSIEAQRDRNNDARNDAMVFDSDNPTGGDPDLATAEQGNLLIVSEDNDSSDPDDAIGGMITFTFDNPAEISLLKVVDTEEGGLIELFDAAGALIQSFDIPRIGDGAIDQVVMGVAGVTTMKVTLNGSGAIDDLCYKPGEPPATASLGDTVFFDLDADGVQDAGEGGVSGVTVILTGGGADGVIGTADDTTATDVTDADGKYRFDGLNPGEEYKITFDENTLPANYAFTTQDAGTNDAVDSDADIDTGMTGIVTLAPDEENLTLDAGIVELAGLGDFVWLDADGDGEQDGGEAGVGGVTVKLLDENGAPVLDDMGQPVVTTTDGAGAYSFTGLRPGTYSVMFVAPAGLVFTAKDAAGDTVDSDADVLTGMTQTVTLGAGEFNGTLDAGLYAPASLGDTVFHDLNANGLQDTGETGIANAEVKLLDGAGNPVLDDMGQPVTTMTDSDGKYAFTGLRPGDYKVMFVQPASFTEVSPVDEGADDAVDSDGDPNDGLMTDVVTLTSGDNNTTLDQGFYNLAGLGDFVWLDEDGDGVQDAGEPGVDGVAVELKDANGNVVASTTTANGGAYSFTGLIPGTYSVQFTAPAGFAFTTANATGVNDADDSDADTATGMTQTVTLESGEFDGTLDAGLLKLENDAAMLCSDTEVAIDVLGNDDGGSDIFSVIAINGESFGPDDAVTLASGAVVRLNGDGTLTYDLTGADDFDDLLLGASDTDSFVYTVSDGNGGEAEASVDVKVCGALNLIETIDNNAPLMADYLITPVTGGFPPMTVRTEVTLDLGDSQANLDYFGVTPGYGQNGQFLYGYCIDRERSLENGPGKALLYSSIADDLPALGNDGIELVDKSENLDLVNWVLNQDYEGQGFTFDDIQSAIWELVDDLGGTDVDLNAAGTQLSSGAQTIVDDAFAFESAMMALPEDDVFVPNAADGDLLGIIIAPQQDLDGDNEFGQVYIVGVGLSPCDCDVM
jgi:protocatechuate 3,4-dioxygenase beta subunit